MPQMIVVEGPTDRPLAPARPASWRDVAQVTGLFLRIGATAFGGPAVHVAMMRHELIARRGWITEQHFLDLLGATNLIPGPNSSEMAMHVGQVRAGWRGLLGAGIAFLLPGMLLTLALAWAYQRYGATPAAGWLLYGIKPVILPLIVLALGGLGRKAARDRLTALVGIAAAALYFLGVNFVVILVLGGLGVLLARRAIPWRALISLPWPGLALSGAALGSGPGWLGLAWAFFKIGALLYGSGYVLFAFMQAELVERHGWLTGQQLLDAIAFGQMTPGPLSTATTFAGYLIAGVPGALLATAAFYLPAFLVVALSNPLISRVRASAWAAHLLDGVNVAALGLMAAVTWELARAAYVDPYTLALGALAGVLLIRFRLNSALLVLIGAAAGLLSALG